MVGRGLGVRLARRPVDFTRSSTMMVNVKSRRRPRGAPGCEFLPLPCDGTAHQVSNAAGAAASAAGVHDPMIAARMNPESLDCSTDGH